MPFTYSLSRLILELLFKRILPIIDQIYKIPYERYTLSLRHKENYIKYSYWLTGSEEARLREGLKLRKNIKIRSAKGIPCTPLDETNSISSVAPEAWNETCSRQGSWYRASDKNGLYLLISSFPLEGYENKEASIITRSGFNPPRFATIEEKKRLALDQEFMRQIPPAWNRIELKEKNIHLRWAKRLGSEINDFDLLHLSHNANHANFIKPQLFIVENHDIIPYSIDRSPHLCSCCLELFQILGSQYSRKLVAPCPGAALFARLKPNQYLWVEKT